MSFLILLIFIVVLLAFFYKRSKVVLILILVLAWVLIGWNTNNADFESYSIRYNFFKNKPNLSLFQEPLFSWLMYWGNKIGLDYMGFKRVLSLFSLLLIFRIFYKYAVDYSFVAAFYLLFIFLLDVTQIRNFIAFSLVISVLPLLLKGKKEALIYMAVILVASMIHISSIFYLLLLLAKYQLNRNKVLILFFLIFALKNTIVSFFGSQFEKILQYEDLVSIQGFIAYAFIQVVNLLFINFVNKKFKIIPAEGSAKYFFTVSSLIVNINWLLLFLIPFYMDSVNFSRLFRNVAILNFIWIANHYARESHSQFIFRLMFLCYGLFFLLVYMVIGGYYEKVILPVFQNNLLFS